MAYYLIQNGVVVYRYATLPVLHPDALVVEGPDEVQEGWLYADGALTPPPAPAAASVADLIGYAALARLRVEVAGITVDAVRVSTDRTSQALISGAVALLAADASVDELDFKSLDGWVTLGRAAMIAIGVAVGRHVQDCFAAERAVDDDIMSGTITTTAQIDAAAWPDA